MRRIMLSPVTRVLAVVSLSACMLAVNSSAVPGVAFAAVEQGEADYDESGDGVRGEIVTLGYLEDVRVGGLGLEMKGKLDTGADTSSVFARDMEVYERKPKDYWVRFRLVGKNGRSIRYDQNVIRFARIKDKRGGRIRRPVIHLPLCVGGKRGVAEINLADRSEFDYDILVGREFLAHRISVDSSQTFAAVEPCEDTRAEGADVEAAAEAVE